MKTFGYILFGLVIILIGGGLIAPSLIDWNQYKGEIETRVMEATGRKIQIGGNLSVSLLPAPALQVDNVTLANIDGANSQNMVTLRSAIVQIALGPLIGGVVQVESFKLVEPVVEVETLADGRSNLEFSPPAKDTDEPTSSSTAQPSTGEVKDDMALPIRVDSFVIENGVIIYRDGASGKVEHISALNANIAAGSLIGPFDMSGGFVRGGLPLNFEVSIGKIIHERTVGFATNLNAGGQGKVNVNGTVVNTPEGPKIKGKFKAEGENLAKLIGYITGGGKLPGVLGQSFALEGEVSADKGAAKIENTIIQLGTTEGEVSLDVGYAKDIDAALKLKLKHADANKWLELPPVITEGAKLPEQVAVVETEDGKPRASLMIQPKKKKLKAADKKEPFKFPENINASIDVSADAIIFMDDAIRDAKFSASLAEGEVTLNQLSAGLPGGTDIAAFGFVSVAPEGPRFEGNIEATASDLRGVMRWLRITVPHIPADRLRKMTVTADVATTPEQMQVTNVKAAFDSSKITGGIAVALRERLSFGADFTLDRLNLDAYIPRSAAKETTAKPDRATPTQKGEQKAAPKSEPVNMFKPLVALTTFDANLKFKVKALTAQGLPAQNARIDATLFKGNLTIRDGGVDNFAGASFKVGGELRKLEGIPVAKGLRAQISAKNTTNLFKFAGIAPPVNPVKLGAVTVDANLDGSLLTPEVKANIKAAGGEIFLSGKANPLSLLTGLKVKTAIRHDNLAQLMDRLSLPYTPSPKAGGIDLSANIEGTKTKITVSDVKGNLAGASVNGNVVADLSGAKPNLTAKFDLGNLAAHLLAPTSSSSPAPAPKVKAPAKTKESRYSQWTPPGGSSASSGKKGRWSTAPLSLAGLHQVNADVKINAQSLAYDKYKVMGAKLAVTLKDGVLDVKQLTGSLFKGQLEGTAQLSAVAQPTFTSTLSLKEGDILSAVRAVTGKDLASGSMSFATELQTTGNSVYDLVSQLGGKGNFAMTKVDARQDASGTAMAGALDLVRSLNSLGGALGGKKGKGLADVTGTYTVLKGVARSEDLKLTSNITKGQAKGTVDLPNWYVDTRGEVTMAQNLLTALLATQVKMPSKVPFTVIGPLDNPSVKLLTGSKSTVTQPQQPSNPVGTLLQQIIPGAQQQQQGTQQQEPKKLKPEDIFKQLLKGGIK
ncbi:MAG: AsmA family protein [Rhodospirillales bacterium]|nr:AsmA family protein [Rhodospirillales bacterium]